MEKQQNSKKKALNKPFSATIIALLIVSVAVFSVFVDAKLGVFKQGEDIELYQTCNNCTYCNWTAVKYPNGSNILTDVAATQSGSRFYTVLGGGNTTIGGNGIYRYCYDCGNAVERATGCIDFEITPTGQDIDSSQGITSIGLIISVLAAGFLFLLLGFKFADSTWFPISLMFIALSILLTVYSLHLGYIYTESILFPLSVQGGQSAIFIGILWSMVALILIGFVFFMMKVIKTALNQKAIRDYGEGYNPKTKMYD